MLYTWVWSQQGLNYTDVERLTYQAFVEGQYDVVKKIGKEALSQNMDYYDLRLRLGIVYFREQHFDNALIHFEKAHQMNPMDVVLQEFLFFTYLNLGKNQTAKRYIDSFESEPKFETYEKLYNGIQAIYGFTGGIQAQQSAPVLDASTVYREQKIQRETYMMGLGALLFLNNRMAFTPNVSVFQVGTESMIDFNNQTEKRTYSNVNMQVSLRATYEYSSRITFGLHTGVFEEKSTSLTSVFIPFEPLTYVEIPYSHLAMFGQAFGELQWRNFKFQSSVGISNFSNTTQNQVETLGYYFPKGNRNLWLLSGLAWVNQKQNQQTLIHVGFGLRFTKALWTEIKCSTGNHLNYLSSDGVGIFNTLDPVLNSGTFKLHYRIQRWVVSPILAWQQRENTNFMITNGGITSEKTTFNNYLMSISLLWKN